MFQQEQTLECLERRIEKLEDRIHGRKLNSNHSSEQSCIEALTKIQNQLQSAVTGKDKITDVFEKLSELEKFLDPGYADSLTLTEAAKLDIMLEEELVRHIIDNLQKVEDMKSVLDSEHIKATPGLTSKLANLSQVQDKQQVQEEALTEEVRNLLNTYNKIITTLTKYFVTADEKLTKLEIAAKPKKLLQ
ncbi:dynactin 3, p24 subunit [Tachypleus tridentatus]|uniref:dynactin 3, p24 subunit n=1 Tax=Tachypleus tridentatus TaxID=6853 RepID=UPI003FCF817C